jgi:hypothetical protein
MRFTHEELLDAVRKAGEDGQAFSCAAVREQLGMSTRDRRELSKFHRRFRAFQDAAPEAIEKVGNNAYRLKPSPAVLEAAPVERQEPLIEFEITTDPAYADGDPDELEASDPVEPVIEALAPPLSQAPAELDPLQLTAAEEPTLPLPDLDAEVPPQWARTWLERGQWLGKRFAEFFSRA